MIGGIMYPKLEHLRGPLTIGHNIRRVLYGSAASDVRGYTKTLDLDLSECHCWM